MPAASIYLLLHKNTQLTTLTIERYVQLLTNAKTATMTGSYLSITDQKTKKTSIQPYANR